MERKIGFAPISHSGKECVLKVELLPHNNLEAATGFEPVIKVLQTSALPLGYSAKAYINNVYINLRFDTTFIKIDL